LRFEVVVAWIGSRFVEVVLIQPSADLEDLLYLQKIGVLYVISSSTFEEHLSRDELSHDASD